MIDKRLIVLDQTLADPIDLITYLSQLAIIAFFRVLPALILG